MAGKDSTRSSPKKLVLRADQIRPLATRRGSCIATDAITVDGGKVGYMVRSKPRHAQDSGWVFMTGHETQTYLDDAGNFGIYDVNTIANCDPEIIAFLDAPAGVAFERQGTPRKFVQVAGDRWKPGTKPVRKFPPPGLPIVDGDYAVSLAWTIRLPERFARELDAGSLVLWRPGLTIRITAFDNHRHLSQAERLEFFRSKASPQRSAERESAADGITRFSYRLREEGAAGPVESVMALVFADEGHLVVTVYFDELADEVTAQTLVDSVVHRANPA